MLTKKPGRPAGGIPQTAGRPGFLCGLSLSLGRFLQRLGGDADLDCIRGLRAAVSPVGALPAAELRDGRGLAEDLLD